MTALQNKIRELELKLEKLRSEHVTLEEHENVKNDLTAARQAALEANKSKTMFLANMSHEIRTPMNSIIGIYNVLSQTKLTDEQREFLEIINISSHNLLAIINDILDLSKIEAGQLKLEYKPYFLHDEVHQVIKLLSLKAKGKGIELYFKIQSTAPTCVIGDAGRLKQVLINLANNAIKFTNEGHVVVSVETMDPSMENLDENMKYFPDIVMNAGNLSKDLVVIKFEVSDTGIGISPEEQKDLFHEFAQLENPLIQKFEGTGLGLSISKNLMKLMNGKIGVISEKGKGSTFWFTLALEKGNDEAILQKTEPVNRQKKSKPLSILIVEDNLLNQKFAVTSLQRAGHNVEIAEHGKVAVEKFKKQHFDLILMDIAMPIMDGIEATHEIRRLESEGKELPVANTGKRIKIIAVTAHVMVTDRDKCLAAGMDDYLAKPYRPQELISIIENLDIE
ncbi:MAG: response regulator [bacterium]